MSQLYEYSVFLDEKRDKDGEIVEEASVIVPVTAILARDEAQAEMLAARAIPEDVISGGKMDRLTVAVRSF